MNFNLYNLLSQLIPGFILLIIGVRVYNIDMNTIPILPSTAIAYVLGYLINAIGSWFEKIIYWSWGGEPAIQVLEGKKCGKYRFYEVDRLKKLLERDKKISNKEIFQISMRLANNNDRVKDINSSYVFSRSILMTLMVGHLILMPLYLKSYLFHIVSICIIFLSCYRAKQIAFSFVKEVFQVSINISEKDA